MVITPDELVHAIAGTDGVYPAAHTTEHDEPSASVAPSEHDGEPPLGSVGG